METSQVSIFAVEVQKNELLSRMQMTDVVNRRRMRHAHMVNITPEIMTQGMRADFNEVDRLSQAVLDKVRQATYVRATTPAGTDIYAQLNSDSTAGSKTSGIISTEKWGNLPGGECFTAPGEKSTESSLSTALSATSSARATASSATQPLTINIEGNRITRVSSANKALERDFWAYTHTDENLDRVGEFAIGNQHRRRAPHRQHPPGRKIPRHPPRLRRPLRRPHRSRLEILHPHRR